MSDLLETTEKSIEITVNGKPYTLTILSAYDRADLIRESRKQRKGELKENLTIAGADAPTIFAELEQLDAKVADEEEWISFVSDVRNDPIIITKSLLYLYKDTEGVAELCKYATITKEQKAKLCGLVITYVDPKQKTPETNPTPGESLVYKEEN